MFIELVDILRCVRPHEDTWLVAQVDRMDGRDIMDGVLGCPVCHAEYPIRDGVVYVTEAPTVARPAARPSSAEAMRLAAALGLVDARLVAVLHGRWGTHAPLVRSLSPAQLLVLNPVAHVTVGDGISVVVSDPAPFAPASVHAIAVDAGATRSVADSLLRSLRPGGRLLAPADFERPPDVSEIARDDEVWVGERQGSATPPIAIAKRGSG